MAAVATSELVTKVLKTQIHQNTIQSGPWLVVNPNRACNKTSKGPAISNPQVQLRRFVKSFCTSIEQSIRT